MGSRRLVVLLVLAVALTFSVEGRPKHSLWNLFGYQGDAPASVHNDGDGHVHSKEHKDGDHHSEQDAHDDKPSNPYSRFFGPIRANHNEDFKKFVRLHWHDHEGHHGEGPNDHIYGHCYLHPDKDYKGDKVEGLVLFKQDRKYGKVHMKLEAHGIVNEHHPHGLHIHEFGDMSEGCKYVGGHYNPFHEKHGGPTDKHHHVGDLGNIVEDKKGDVHLERDLHLVSMTGPYSVIGRSLVVSENADDLGHGHEDSLTTGHSGKSIACCTIAVDDGHDWYKKHD